MLSFFWFYFYAVPVWPEGGIPSQRYIFFPLTVKL